VRARIWGCRGSLAAPGPDTVHVGGNTSCVALELEDGTPVILDAGTGIRLLGREFAASPQRTIHLCLTHLHVDHIEGLGFFGPLWDEKQELHIWGPPSPIASLEERLSRYLSPPLFPVPLAEMPATVHFHDLPEEEFELGSARVLAQPVAHRGPTVGFRFEEEGASLAYIPDHEPYLGVAPGEVEPEWLSGFALAERVGILLHDAQYSESEYGPHRGFGHSSVAHAVAFAQVAEVEQLILFHHDPSHSDDELGALEERAGELWARTNPSPKLGVEAMELRPTRRRNASQTAVG
jgi:phosphoribosyl 1,2-cyclic phosphodiesterase